MGHSTSAGVSEVHGTNVRGYSVQKTILCKHESLATLFWNYGQFEEKNTECSGHTHFLRLPALMLKHEFDDVT